MSGVSTRSHRSSIRAVETTLAELSDLLKANKSIVMITGAGLSAASGIPTFRGGSDSVWSVTAASQGRRSVFLRDPLRWYNEFFLRHFPMSFTRKRPNAGHEAIAALAREFPGLRVVTQNIDGLHQDTVNAWPDPLRLIEAHGRLGLFKCINDDAGNGDDSSDGSAESKDDGDDGDDDRIGANDRQENGGGVGGEEPQAKHNRRQKDQGGDDDGDDDGDNDDDDDDDYCPYSFDKEIRPEEFPESVRARLEDGAHAAAAARGLGRSLTQVPRCPGCGQAASPMSLLFDEDYDSHSFYDFEKAEDWFKEADAVVFVGTSFAVTLTSLAIREAKRRGIPVFDFNVSVCLKASPALDAKTVLGRAEATLPALARAAGVSFATAASASASAAAAAAAAAASGEAAAPAAEAAAAAAARGGGTVGDCASSSASSSSASSSSSSRSSSSASSTSGRSSPPQVKGGDEEEEEAEKVAGVGEQEATPVGSTSRGGGGGGDSPLGRRAREESSSGNSSSSTTTTSGGGSAGGAHSLRGGEGPEAKRVKCAGRAGGDRAAGAAPSASAAAAATAAWGNGAAYLLEPALETPLRKDQVRVDVAEAYSRKTHPDPEVEANIEALWQEQLSKNPLLFNASKFRLAGYSTEGDHTAAVAAAAAASSDTTESSEGGGEGAPAAPASAGGPAAGLRGGATPPPPSRSCSPASPPTRKLRLRLGLTDYRTFRGTNWSPSAARLAADSARDHPWLEGAYLSQKLGVGAVVETADGFLLSLCRSGGVAEGQGMMGAPGGHPEPEKLGLTVDVLRGLSRRGQSSRRKAGQQAVDELFDSAVQEVVDETNVPRSTLGEPLLAGLVRQGNSFGAPTAAFIIPCSLGRAEVSALYARGAKEAFESTGLRTIPAAEMIAEGGSGGGGGGPAAWFAKRGLTATPSFQGALELWREYRLGGGGGTVCDDDKTGALEL